MCGRSCELLLVPGHSSNQAAAVAAAVAVVVAVRE
jgi:hypothetical protein